jgi:hypothetical protein
MFRRKSRKLQNYLFFCWLFVEKKRNELKKRFRKAEKYFAPLKKTFLLIALFWLIVVCAFDKKLGKKLLFRFGVLKKKEL